MLRPYQIKAVNAIEKEWEAGHKKTLLVMATGTGKTVVFAEVIRKCVDKGMKVLVIAHRDELLEQARDKILSFAGLGSAKEEGAQTAQGSLYRVTVGSVQTMMRADRLEKIAPDEYGAIIVDEAHHILASSYQTVLNHFPNAYVLGVTATPDRGDMKNLGQFFDSLAYEYNLPQAVKEGCLVPLRARTVPLDIDLSSVHMSNGDFSVKDTGNALDPYLDAIADEMRDYCIRKKTIVFLPLIKTSQKFCELLTERGFNAIEINGKTENRNQILKDFEDGKYNVICNSMLLTEGFDCPAVDCIVSLRPTKIRSLYAQIIGRGTRLYPGKKNLLILDFLWNTSRLDLCHPASVISNDMDMANKATQQMAKSNEEVDLSSELEIASEALQAERLAAREEALAKQLQALRHKKAKLVDPLQFEMSIQSEDLANYVPTFGWEMKPATEKQIQTLSKYGINAEEMESGKASLLLNKLSKRRDAKMSTPKQIRFLEQRNFQKVGTWTSAQASDMIVKFRKNNWRLPKGVIPKQYVPPEMR